MDFGKAMGILIIVACLIAVFFLIIHRRVIGDITDGNESRLTANLSYFICYLIFTFCTWGFILAIIYGIELIVR